MKRQINTAGLKVKFLPATNEKPNRLKITQTNFNKSVIVSNSENGLEFICRVLENTEEVRLFSLIVDNTQNDYYLFSVDFHSNSFENILNNFKK